MKKFKDEFVQSAHKSFKFKIGNSYATALTGFIAGFIVAAVVLMPLGLIVCRFRLQ